MRPASARSCENAIDRESECPKIACVVLFELAEPGKRPVQNVSGGTYVNRGKGEGEHCVYVTLLVIP